MWAHARGGSSPLLSTSRHTGVGVFLCEGGLEQVSGREESSLHAEEEAEKPEGFYKNHDKIEMSEMSSPWHNRHTGMGVSIV
jgi:hypothetical protein